MSGYENEWSDSDFDNEGGRQGGGGLRKMLEESLAENKKLLEKLNGKEREADAAALLKGKGLDPALVALIPPNEDPKAWLAEKGHLLGIKSDAVDEDAGEPEVQVASDDDPAVQARKQELAAEQAALAGMQDAAESGSPAINADVLERLDKIESEEELMKFFNSNGAVGG